MKAEVITIGTEILVGAITNTNGPYISRLLTDVGIDVCYHQSIRDDKEDIKTAVKTAINRADIIFLCGGLGPTKDDMTKEMVAEALGLKIVYDKQAMEYLKTHFRNKKYEMTKNNMKQAYIIENSRIIKNNNGTAPGAYLMYNKRHLYLLPGPPREFEPMANYIVKNLLPKENSEILMKSLNVMLLGESTIEDRLRKLNLENEHLEINTFAKLNEVEIKIIAHVNENTNIKKARIEMIDTIDALYREFGDYIYGEDNGPIAEALVSLLRRRNKTISVCESVTGGLISRLITAIPHASEVFEYGIVTYSNEAKIKELNVCKDTLDKYGAVSSQTASEMSLGLFKKTGANYTISTTGEAGPITSENHPVGTVYYSIHENGKEIDSDCLHLKGNREYIQLRAAKTILSNVLLGLKRS